MQRRAYDGYGKNSVSRYSIRFDSMLKYNDCNDTSIVLFALFQFVDFMFFFFVPPITNFRENMLDATAVFTILFGSELFEDYIGHLAVATMASSELASSDLTSENDNPEKLQDRLKARFFYDVIVSMLFSFETI